MHDVAEIEVHDRGLAHDLKVMEATVARQRALKWFVGAGTAALVAGCGGDESSGGVTVVDGGTATATPTPSPTPTPTSSAACVADPSETAGPYACDGTNSASGSTSNALTATGIVRSDIRPSFIGSTTVATGVQVTLTLTWSTSTAPARRCRAMPSTCGTATARGITRSTPRRPNAICAGCR